MRRLFKNCPRQIYFFYIFIQQYTFYLLIFLWTGTKLIVNLELREKFTQWKKPREFHDNEIEIISGENELLCRCGTIYNVQSILISLSPHWGCGAYSRAALINFFVTDAALIRVNTVLVCWKWNKLNVIIVDQNKQGAWPTLSWQLVLLPRGFWRCYLSYGTKRVENTHFRCFWNSLPCKIPQ